MAQPEDDGGRKTGCPRTDDKTMTMMIVNYKIRDGDALFFKEETVMPDDNTGISNGNIYGKQGTNKDEGMKEEGESRTPGQEEWKPRAVSPADASGQAGTPTIGSDASADGASGHEDRSNTIKMKTEAPVGEQSVITQQNVMTPQRTITPLPDIAPQLAVTSQPVIVQRSSACPQVPIVPQPANIPPQCKEVTPLAAAAPDDEEDNGDGNADAPEVIYRGHEMISPPATPPKLRLEFVGNGENAVRDVSACESHQQHHYQRQLRQDSTPVIGESAAPAGIPPPPREDDDASRADVTDTASATAAEVAPATAATSAPSAQPSVYFSFTGEDLDLEEWPPNESGALAIAEDDQALEALCEWVAEELGNTKTEEKNSTLPIENIQETKGVDNSQSGELCRAGVELDRAAEVWRMTVGVAAEQQQQIQQPHCSNTGRADEGHDASMMQWQPHQQQQQQQAVAADAAAESEKNAHDFAAELGNMLDLRDGDLMHVDQEEPSPEGSADAFLRNDYINHSPHSLDLEPFDSLLPPDEVASFHGH